MKDIQKFTVILDNGHGDNTTGKRSPDGKLREYAYCREITKRIAEGLKPYNIRAEIIVPELYDVTLEQRVKRCNRIVTAQGVENCIFISVHNNAAGCGGWMSARGWSVFVYRTASNSSFQLANCLYDATVSLGIGTRKPRPNQKYWECGFYVCKYTKCPAVLTENLFQDNKEDVAFLLSEDGKSKVAQLHINGILQYYKLLYVKEPAPTPQHKCDLK